MRIGDYIPVEIAGTEIGSAILSEITDEWVEVVYMGHAIRLSPDVLDYLELREAVSDL